MTGPTEVRFGLRYVLNNARRHAVRLAGGVPDPFSSGVWFQDWVWACTERRKVDAPNSLPETWLLREGWKMGGPIPINQRPGKAA